MRNEGLKQANALANWFDANDVMIDDITITIKLKDGSLYKIMSDGSIALIPTDTSNAHAFVNAAEAISMHESKMTTDSKEAVFKIKLPLDRLMKKQKLTEENIKSFFSDMTVDSIDDNFAYLTYVGSKEEEPATIAVDIQRKYGVRPISINRK